MDIPVCMTVEEIGIAMLDDEHKSMLSELKLHGWPLTKAEVHMQFYWLYETAIIDSIAMEGRIIIIPGVPQDKTLKELHLNHMGIQKIWLLAYESIY